MFTVQCGSKYWLFTGGLPSWSAYGIDGRRQLRGRLAGQEDGEPQQALPEGAVLLDRVGPREVRQELAVRRQGHPAASPRASRCSHSHTRALLQPGPRRPHAEEAPASRLGPPPRLHHALPPPRPPPGAAAGRQAHLGAATVRAEAGVIERCCKSGSHTLK